MTFFAYHGTLTTPAVNGNVAYTQPGFTPKVVIFWNSQSSPGFGSVDAADAVWGFGFCTAPTQALMSGGGSGNGLSGATSGGSAVFPGNAGTIVGATGGYNTQGTLVSFDATGFTINWTIGGGNAFVGHYLALGGTDLSVASVALTPRTTTGTQPITGVGFQPKLLLFAGAGAVNPPGAASNWIGAAVSPTSRWAMSQSTTNGASMSTTNLASRIQDTTKCISVLGASGVTTTMMAADLTSMDADGFTLNWTTASATAINARWLALGGPALFGLGTILKNANTTDTTISVNAGLIQTPVAYMLFGQSATNTTAQSTGWRGSIGGTDGTRWSADAWEQKTAVLPTQSRHIDSISDTLIQRALPASISAAGATEVQLRHSAFTTTGFNLTYQVNAAAVAYIYPYLTFSGPGISMPATGPAGPADRFNL